MKKRFYNYIIFTTLLILCVSSCAKGKWHDNVYLTTDSKLLDTYSRINKNYPTYPPLKPDALYIKITEEQKSKIETIDIIEFTADTIKDYDKYYVAEGKDSDENECAIIVPKAFKNSLPVPNTLCQITATELKDPEYYHDHRFDGLTYPYYYIWTIGEDTVFWLNKVRIDGYTHVPYSKVYVNCGIPLPDKTTLTEIENQRRLRTPRKIVVETGSISIPDPWKALDFDARNINYQIIDITNQTDTEYVTFLYPEPKYKHVRFDYAKDYHSPEKTKGEQYNKDRKFYTLAINRGIAFKILKPGESFRYIFYQDEDPSHKKGYSHKELMQYIYMAPFYLFDTTNIYMSEGLYGYKTNEAIQSVPSLN